MRVVAASASHVGMVREANQDRAMCASTLGAVADGMGGHAGGERAAAMAIAELNGVRGAVSERRLIDVIEAANRRIYEAAAEPSLRGMGTTVVAAGFDPGSEVVTIVNVGDSRAYLYRSGELLQVTVDHSLVEDLVRDGRLTAEEARIHPQRNIVTRALGIAPEVEVDSFAVEIQRGDRVLLASDGLTNEVSTEGIIEVLGGTDEPGPAAEVLISEALAGGGRDNVTVVVMDFLDDDEFAAEEQSSTDQASTEQASTEQSAAEDSGASKDAETDAEGSGDPRSDVARPRKRRFPLRGFLVLVGVVAVVSAAGFSTASYARSGYFADGREDVVAIYRGRPGGVLWFKPELIEEHPELKLDLLDGASRQRLEQRPVWSSIEDAREFIENFEQSTSGS